MTEIINILDKAVQRRLVELCEICEDLETLGFFTRITVVQGRPPHLEIRRLATTARPETDKGGSSI